MQSHCLSQTTFIPPCTPPFPAMLLAHLSSGDPAVPNTSNQCNEDVLEPLRVCQMHPGRVPQHLLIMHVRPRKVVPIVQLDPCAASAPHTSRRRRFSTTQWCIATFDVRPACHSYSRVAMHSAHEPITTIVYIRLELTIFERNCKVAAKLLQCLRLQLIMWCFHIPQCSIHFVKQHTTIAIFT